MHSATKPVPDETTTGKHIPALDGVRGLALLIVMARHLLSRPHASDSAAASRLVYYAIDTGWVGVDLFFALSGFLITGILYDVSSCSSLKRLITAHGRASSKSLRRALA